MAIPNSLAGTDNLIGRDDLKPIVAHDEARKKTLARYGVVKSAKGLRN